MSDAPDSMPNEGGRPEGLSTPLGRLLEVLSQYPDLLSTALNLSPQDRKKLRLARQHELAHGMALEFFEGMSRRQQSLRMERALIRYQTAPAATALGKAAKEMLAIAGRPLSASRIRTILSTG